MARDVKGSGALFNWSPDRLLFQLRVTLRPARLHRQQRLTDSEVSKASETPGKSRPKCAKGARDAESGPPIRIDSYPLERAGKRGEGKWERVGWDEVLDHGSRAHPQSNR